MIKTAGVAGVLNKALSALADRILIAFVYGSIARGGDRRVSDVDILVVGSATFADIVHSVLEHAPHVTRTDMVAMFSIDSFSGKIEFAQVDETCQLSIKIGQLYLTVKLEVVQASAG